MCLRIASQSLCHGVPIQGRNLCDGGLVSLPIVQLLVVIPFGFGLVISIYTSSIGRARISGWAPRQAIPNRFTALLRWFETILVQVNEESHDARK